MSLSYRPFFWMYRAGINQIGIAFMKQPSRAQWVEVVPSQLLYSVVSPSLRKAHSSRSDLTYKM